MFSEIQSILTFSNRILRHQKVTFLRDSLKNLQQRKLPNSSYVPFSHFRKESSEFSSRHYNASSSRYHPNLIRFLLIATRIFWFSNFLPFSIPVEDLLARNFRCCSRLQRLARFGAHLNEEKYFSLITEILDLFSLKFAYFKVSINSATLPSLNLLFSSFFKYEENPRSFI